MLIGLWGSEPQQINFSERIMAQADIKHPPPPQTHIFILLRTREGVKERGKAVRRGRGWKTRCDYECVTRSQRES